MTRIAAASSHLLLSIIIFSIVIWLLVFFWYPAPHFNASGGWQGLKIAAGVDLVLGPLLTLIIFDIKKSKQKLIGDLTVIAIIQFTALGLGINTIYQQRPVAVIFWEDGFYSVPAIALKNQSFDVNNFKEDKSSNPAVIYAEKPKIVQGLKNMYGVILKDKIAPHHQVGLYRPFKKYFPDIKSFQVDINEIIDTNNEMKIKLEQILVDTNTKIEDYLYFSLYSKYYNIILLFSDDGKLQNYITVPLRES